MNFSIQISLTLLIIQLADVTLRLLQSISVLSARSLASSLTPLRPSSRPLASPNSFSNTPRSTSLAPRDSLQGRHLGRRTQLSKTIIIF